MGALSTIVPLTHGARVIRGPWLGLGWDVAGMLVVSVALTAVVRAPQAPPGLCPGTPPNFRAVLWTR
jgi:hypothetical protein